MTSPTELTATEPPDPASEPEDRSQPPPPPRRKRRVKSVRIRLSLDLTEFDHANVLQLAAVWGMSIHAAITRAVTIALKIHGQENPEWRWPAMEAKDRPLPGFWAYHEPQRDGTERVFRLVIP